VEVRPLGDGLAELAAVLPAEVAEACREMVHGCATAAKADGDDRPLGALRAAALVDLLLRPWDDSRPPITAHLLLAADLDTLWRAAHGRPTGEAASASGATSAGGATSTGDAASTGGATPTGDTAAAADGTSGFGAGTAGTGPRSEAWAAEFRIFDPDGHPQRPPEPPLVGPLDPADPAPVPPARPATVNGHPITAAHLRGLLERLDALCPGGLQPPAGGDLSIALTDSATGALRAVVDRRRLERLVRRGCPDHPPEACCDCPVLDRPEGVDRYRPSDAQVRFVRTRDQRCRMPGCTARAGWADLDHVVAHAAGGATDCANLCCLCRRHHRLKTHTPGWRFGMSDDGVLTVTTPAGITRSTRPPDMLLHAPPDDRGGGDAMGAGFGGGAERRGFVLPVLPVPEPVPAAEAPAGKPRAEGTAAGEAPAEGTAAGEAPAEGEDDPPPF
jgi:hypothetical protein